MSVGAKEFLSSANSVSLLFGRLDRQLVSFSGPPVSLGYGPEREGHRLQLPVHPSTAGTSLPLLPHGPTTRIIHGPCVTHGTYSVCGTVNRL